jgi:hypothetical protein
MDGKDAEAAFASPQLTLIGKLLQGH